MCQIRSFLRIWSHLLKKCLMKIFIFVQCLWTRLKLSILRRSSRREGFCKKSVLKSLKKSTGKHLCWILFFYKVVDLRPVTLLKKKKFQHRLFPVNFVKFLRTLLDIEYLCWKLLTFYHSLLIPKLEADGFDSLYT